jgi:hypothetical protein
MHMARGAGNRLADESDISGTKAAQVDWFDSDLALQTPDSVDNKPVAIKITVSY